MVPTSLTIAGSDSGGGAGIQGDLKTFEALGVFGLSVITSVTSQNTRRVAGVYDLPPEVVALQLRTVLEDVRVDAAKTGMLSSTAIIETVADEIERSQIRNLVVDPVMRAKSGDPLIASNAEQSLRDRLFPLALVVTPNVPEAESLTGARIRTVDEMKEAAKRFMEFKPRSVLIKGGHLESMATAVDILFDGEEFYEFTREKIEVAGGVHGTGCALSAAITAGLARGSSLLSAIEAAKEYVTGAMAGSYHIGGGHPVLAHRILRRSDDNLQ
jgi:hydroxymethylpyrimidine/phosphomethylpyrimidine kinase